MLVGFGMFTHVHITNEVSKASLRVRFACREPCKGLLAERKNTQSYSRSIRTSSLLHGFYTNLTSSYPIPDSVPVQCHVRFGDFDRLQSANLC